jgi:glycosyltransferase involved in cell wall biosynthesis
MAVNISNVLAAEGHHVLLVSSRAGGPLEQFVERNVSYKCLNKKSGLDRKAFSRFLKLIRQNHIDVIHAHSSSVFWAVAAKLFLWRVRVIWHDHLGKRLEEEKFNRVIIIISIFIDGVISVNDVLKSWSQKNLRAKRENIVFINNFPLLPPPGTIKKENEGIINIVCLANLRSQKDHLTLIRAIHYLVAHYKVDNFKLQLAGQYLQDLYFQSIRYEIEQFQIESYIEVIGSVSNTSELLHKSDMGVLSSISEGLPVSLLEYGLAGLPVVVTDVGQCAEVVDYGKAGLVVPPSDPEALAGALLDLIQNPVKRNLLGSRLKERVELEYGSKMFMAEYQKLLERVLAK